MKIEPMEAPMTCKSIKGTLTADDGPAFRWWTCGVLMFYSASLLVFCGLVTLQKDHPADGLRRHGKLNALWKRGLLGPLWAK